jgi:argininosuccinate lyase
MPSPYWKDLYDQAVLEPHPDKVLERVQIACDAIHQYRMEKGRWLSAEEREEINSALKALFVLVERRAA